MKLVKVMVRHKRNKR